MNIMGNMNSEQFAACHGIIHAASAAAGATGAGLAQLPCSDSAVITPIQLAMTIALGQVFDLELSDSAAKAAMASAAGASIGRMVSQVLIGWIPGVGNAVNAATAASITEALGWLLVKDFSHRMSYAQCGGGF